LRTSPNYTNSATKIPIFSYIVEKTFGNLVAMWLTPIICSFCPVKTGNPLRFASRLRATIHSFFLLGVLSLA